MMIGVVLFRGRVSSIVLSVLCGVQLLWFGGAARAQQTAEAGFAAIDPLDANGEVSIVDATGHVGKLMLAGRPRDVALSPNGALLLAVTVEPAALKVFDTQSRRLLAESSIGPAPEAIAVDPDGSRAYVAIPRTNEVIVLDISEARSGRLRYVAAIQVGVSPSSIAVSPTRPIAYVANFSDDTLSVIGTVALDASGPPIEVGPKPAAVAFDPLGDFAYVANVGDSTACPLGSVSIVPAFEHRVAATVCVGAQPFDVAVAPDGLSVVTTNLGDSSISLIDTDPASASYRTARSIPVPHPPTAVAFSTVDEVIYVAGVVLGEDGSVVGGAITLVDRGSLSVSSETLVAKAPVAVVVGLVPLPPSPTPTPTTSPTRTPLPCGATACEFPQVCRADRCVVPLVGDFDGTGSVTVDEIVQAFSIALGQRFIPPDAYIDLNGDGFVRVDELQSALVVALEGRSVTPSPAPSASVVIKIENVTFRGSGTVPISVRLETNGASVAAVQNDIIFDNTKVSLANAQACRINPAIGLVPNRMDCADDTSFGPCKNLSRLLNACGGSPQGVGCPPGASSNISVFRGIIAASAVPNLNAIPDGVLYTCDFTVAARTELIASVVVASDPYGGRLSSRGEDGSVEVVAGPTPTPTAFAGATVTRTSTPEAALIEVGSNADPGQTATIHVRLQSRGKGITATQHDIVFDHTVVDLEFCEIGTAIGNFPRGPDVDCFDDPLIGPCKSLSTRVYDCGENPKPEICPPSAGDGASVLRAVVAGSAVPNDNQIPDGNLYRCVFRVVNDRALPTLLKISRVIVADAFGNRLLAIGRQGSIGNTARKRCYSVDCAAQENCIGSLHSCYVELCSPPDVCVCSSHPLCAPTPTPGPSVLRAGDCIGDCLNDHSVTVDDLVRMISAALGQRGVGECFAADGNEDADITVEEILGSVNAALAGCPRVSSDCGGDCGEDGRVTVEETQQLIAIGLGQSSATPCPSADANQDGGIDGDEIRAATSAILRTCTAASTP